MNYVTSIFSSVKGYYDGINGATLTGALDVIVVRQPDGSFVSSPFHVRFGKLNVLQSTEKLVDITCNGKPISLQMKLGSNGEAFFVKECEQGEVCDELLSTSPIQREVPDELLNRMRQESTYTEDEESNLTDYSDFDRDEEFYHGYEPEDVLSDSELLNHQYEQQRMDSCNNNVVWDWGTLPHENLPPGSEGGEGSSIDGENAGFMRGMWDYMGHRRKRKNTYSGTLDVQDGMFLDDIDTDDPMAVSHYFGIGSNPRSNRRARTIGEDDVTEMMRNEEKFRRLDALSLEAPRYHTPLVPSNTEQELPGISTQTQTRTILRRNKRTQTSVEYDPADSEIYLSLCGDDEDQFFDHLVTYEQIQDDPMGLILEDPDLVVKCGDAYYNWTSAPKDVLLAMAFRECRPSILEEELEERHRSFTYASDDPYDEEVTPRYKKTVRLSSDEIASLELHDGPNYLTFSVTTSLQGTTKCVCTVYLWDYTDKIIISDIDGTITRSDVFGHILPWVGKDWTQNNIAKLFTVLESNGYKFLYLSSRAIGQASMTKNFLRTIKQNGVGVPEGPILLSPDSLLRALKDEVILKRPHIFKIRCLSDIKSLFGENSSPFYAGFGNRTSDSKSYQAVGIPKHRVYIINHRGEIYTENSLVQHCTYAEIYDANEVYFPPLHIAHTRAGEEIVEEEFLAQNFWRTEIVEFDEEDLVL